MRLVRRLCLLGMAVFALVGAGSASAAVSRGNVGAISIAPAFSSTELNAFSGDNWLTPGGGITDNRYSTLTQINRTNVAGLQVAWQSQLGIPVKLQPTVSLRWASRSRICAWTVTSRAVVGSSATTSEGDPATAIAIMTRWRSPPDS